MKEYFINVSATFYTSYSVSAESEQEAVEIAKENFEYEYSSGWDDFEAQIIGDN